MVREGQFLLCATVCKDQGFTVSEGTRCVSINSVRAGVFQTLPVALGVFAYGMVYGLLTKEAGLSLATC